MGKIIVEIYNGRIVTIHTDIKAEVINYDIQENKEKNEKLLKECESLEYVFDIG